MPTEFSVRIEYDPDAEGDPALFWFIIRRVVSECEQRDLIPIGELTVLPKEELPWWVTMGNPTKPVILHFEQPEALARYTQEVARLKRRAAGIPDPVRLEA